MGEPGQSAGGSRYLYLASQLVASLPLTLSKATQLLGQVRERHGGSLTGLTVKDIKLEVELLLSERLECSICLGLVSCGSQEELEQCGHIFHSQCVGRLQAAGARKCPVCREPLKRGDAWQQAQGSGRRKRM